MGPAEWIALAAVAIPVLCAATAAAYKLGGGKRENGAPTPAQMTREMHALILEWEKHRWPEMIEALENSAVASADAARATRLLVSLIESGALTSSKIDGRGGSKS